jgi:hypothetical protein
VGAGARAGWEAQPGARAAAAQGDLGSGADSSCEEDDDFPNIPFFSLVYRSVLRQPFCDPVNTFLED